MGLSLTFKPEVTQPAEGPAPVTYDPFKETAPARHATRETSIQEAIGQPVSVRQQEIGDIAAVIKEGVICRVRASYERGSLRLSPKDLGLMDTDGASQMAKDRIIQFGRKFLMPPTFIRALDSAVSCARKALYSHSIRTSYGFWVPTSRWEAFKAEFTEAQETFNSHIEKYQPERAAEWVRREYRKLAPLAWPAYREDWCEKNNVPLDSTDDVEPPPKFVAEFSERVVALMPTKDVIGEGSLHYELSILTSPAEDLVAKFSNSNKSLQDELRDHLVTEKKSLIDDFLKSTQRTLLNHLTSTLNGVQERLAGYDDGRKTVNNKTVGKILSVLRDVQDLNVTGDAAINEVLAAMQTFLEENADPKKDGRYVVSQEDLLKQIEEASARINLMVDELTAGSEFENL